MKKKHPWFDAHEIVPGLWQGSLPPNGLILRNAGFGTLVLCARELQVPDIYFPEVRVIHAPNDDHPEMPLTAEKLRTAIVAAREVSKALQAGDKSLVTCAAGLNRSGLVSALALHMTYGWSGEDCISKIRAARESRKYPELEALSNSEFCTVLRRLPANS